MYFHSKWLDHILLMTSYFVTIELTITELNSKCARGMNEQLLKKSGADHDVLSSRRKLRKTLGVGIHNLPPYLVRPRLNDTTSLLTLKMTTAQVYETSVSINHYRTEDNTSKTII